MVALACLPSKRKEQSVKPRQLRYFVALVEGLSSLRPVARGSLDAR
jgi:hypothetical protein